MSRKMAVSLSPHPPPLDVIGLILEALGPILEIAGKKFPSPNVPLNFIREIIRRAHEELKEGSSSKTTHQNETILLSEDAYYKQSETV